jgi:triacylglycerol lipase
VNRIFILFAIAVTLLPRPGVARAAGYTETRFPIVLAHGMAGFGSVFGVIDYWYKIPAALRKDGAEVFVARVSQFHHTEERGEQLLAQVEEIVAITGKPKVHIIGHSHGGLDARYVAAVRPDLVASVTTIGSPHHGADMANFLRNHVVEDSFAEGAVGFLGNKLGAVLALLSGSRHPQDARAALDALTNEGMADFNARYPQGLPLLPCADGPEMVNGVRYFSWSGTRAATNILDISDLTLFLASRVYGEDNDGLVGRCSSHLGKVIRSDYAQNHLDEVNQLLGLVHLFSSSPISIFRAHANRLRNLGL